MLSSVLIHTCHRPTKILANCILRFYRFQFLLDFAFCWILYQFSTSTHVTFFSKKKSYKDNDLKCNEKYFSIRFSLLAPMAPDIKKEAHPKMLVLTVTGLGLSYQIDPPPTLEPIWHLSARVSADLVYFLIFYRTCCIQRLFQFLPGCFKLHAYISITCCITVVVFFVALSLNWDETSFHELGRNLWVKEIFFWSLECTVGEK